ncbi:zinc finger CCCH domain-containing protein 2-like [Phoenix dactylifera]|uniref:Zinc finger CCCH domain-containing protein 2-like n=1 Tax=Phoenix dactylifera TaxID=42345 RepID=A0A8B7CGB1_PHODC|nr:zinc finger CCCH domain-containing protein 2-like [Phoenix dactylifera]
MMMGEGSHYNPTVHVPPWTPFDDPTAGVAYNLPVSGVTGDSGHCSPYALGEAALAALQRYLPCNEPYSAGEDSDESELADAPVDAYSCDEFRMYEFKVRRCARGRSHDWTECPYAHPGEKARRRDPRKYHYSGTACPDFRKGNCKRGDACEFAHGVFECWLHPSRYRTQPCKDGTACRRRVCFFAHTPEQLRVLPEQQQQQQLSPRTAAAMDSYDGSPLRHQHTFEPYVSKNLFSSSPTSTLISPPISPPSESPPMSPSGGPGVRRSSWPVNEVLASLRQLQLSKVRSAPNSWGYGMGGGAGFGSPRGGTGFRAGFCSLPSTPTAGAVGGGAVFLEGPEGGSLEEEEAVERVESGRPLRAKMFERLSKDSVLEKPDAATPAGPAPDVGWVSELVK